MSKELHNTIQEDWDNRDVIEGIVLGMQQMTGFLTRFGIPSTMLIPSQKLLLTWLPLRPARPPVTCESGW